MIQSTLNTAINKFENGVNKFEHGINSCERMINSVSRFLVDLTSSSLPFSFENTPFGNRNFSEETIQKIYEKAKLLSRPELENEQHVYHHSRFLDPIENSIIKIALFSREIVSLIEHKTPLTEDDQKKISKKFVAVAKKNNLFANENNSVFENSLEMICEEKIREHLPKQNLLSYSEIIPFSVKEGFTVGINFFCRYALVTTLVNLLIPQTPYLSTAATMGFLWVYHMQLKPMFCEELNQYQNKQTRGRYEDLASKAQKEIIKAAKEAGILNLDERSEELYEASLNQVDWKSLQDLELNDPSNEDEETIEARFNVTATEETVPSNRNEIKKENWSENEWKEEFEEYSHLADQALQKGNEQEYLSHKISKETAHIELLLLTNDEKKFDKIAEAYDLRIQTKILSWKQEDKDPETIINEIDGEIQHFVEVDKGRFNDKPLLTLIQGLLTTERLKQSQWENYFSEREFPIESDEDEDLDVEIDSTSSDEDQGQE